MGIISSIKEISKQWNSGRSIRWESKIKIISRPLVAIAWGPDANGDSNLGHAKGILAIGQVASGIIAIGLISYGFISIGLISFSKTLPFQGHTLKPS